MKAETRLDSVVFQLTPTRTRCELVISSKGETEKLASGLLNPFLTHLKTAEEQIAKGGYSIRLEPPSGNDQHASWFTKGTIERFVRFVSTPEVLERVNTTETEIIQIEEAIATQCSESLLTEEQPSKSSSTEQKEATRPIVDDNSETAIVPYKSRRHSIDGNESAYGGNSKACLLRVLETRKIVLQKEQGMAFARAAAAGFDTEHMHDLVAFADCFGAFRLREACISFMNLWKKKQEAGLWLEEMELENMEASSTRSEMALMNASGITLTSDSVVRHLKTKDFPDGWSDVPSEVGDSKVSSNDDMSGHGKSNAAEARSDANGELAGLNHHRAENRSSLEGQVSPPLAGSNDYLRGHLQQPMMPVWPGQPPQYIQNFQSHGIGPGPTMQGLHGFPMQGTPYFPGYPPNPPFYQGIYPQTDDHRGLGMPPPHSFSHWPQYAEDPRFGTTQRTDSHAMTGISPDLKRHATDEKDNNIKSEASETGTPKSLSRSLDLADHDTDSEQEKEHMFSQESHRHLRRRSTSPCRRSSSPRRKVQIGRAGNKRSGMVVIRNINYITSKKHDRPDKEDISENSKSETDSDFEDELKRQAEDGQLHVQDVIDLFEKKRRQSLQSSLKKANRRHSADSWNSGDVKGKSARNDAGAEVVDRRDDDSESWSVFQKYLLQDDGSSHNNPHEVDKVDQGGMQNFVTAEDIITVDRREGWESNNAFSLEQDLVSKKKEQGIQKDSLVLPERSGEVKLFDSQQMDESEGSSVCKKTTYDDFIISREAGQTTSRGAGSDPFAGGEIEHTTNQRSDYNFIDKSHGQSIEDDSFMVSARSMSQYQTSNEWRTVMSIDSELPSAEKTKHSSNGLQKNQYEITDGYEHDELYMMPERVSERESLGVQWDPAMDYEIQANVADKVHLDADINGSLDESKSAKEKADSKVNEHPKTKKSEKELRLKAMQEALEKRKLEMAARNAKLGKPSPLAEAQMRAEKLRAFKASLQKTKKEMEEEERNRLEELKIQRQKRIAARRSTSPTSSSSTSRTVKSQQFKTGQASKLLSPSSQKGRTSRNLSPGGSFPSPSSSRSITRSSSEISNELRSRRPNASRQTKSTGTALSRSVPSLSELKKEQEGTFQAGRRLSATKKSNDQIVSAKSGKESGSIKPNGTTSHSTGRASDNLDPKRRQLPITKKSVVTGNDSKYKSLKASLDLDTSSQKSTKQTGVHGTQRGKGSILAADAGNMKSKGNTAADVSEKHNDDVVFPAEESTKSIEPDTVIVPRAEVSVEFKDKENGFISDVESEKKVGASPECIPIHAPTLMGAVGVTNQDPYEPCSDSGHAKQFEAVGIRAPLNMVEENETEKVCESESVPVGSLGMHNPTHSAQSDIREDEALQVSSARLQSGNTDEPYKAPLARITSFDDTPDNKSSMYDAPFAPETAFGPLGIFIPRAPVSDNNSSDAVTSDFPNSSPLLQNMPKLLQSISPVGDSGKSDISLFHQKGSSGEKHKENTKGIRRFLKFGRKGHNRSTAYDNYDDADRLRQMESRVSEDQGQAAKDYANVKSQIPGIPSDNGISSQANSLGNLISQDDNSSETNTHKASRSFFSLSAFRSKGNETKSR